ncbi:hypothetical protein [Runella slithyformis]|uniref:Uncharacterized protein n=1 Tax=Runella slithyformis (strain ATCC 29530 / DSM 19594 / LMG 11500 / NCIMB 11436 / LSU 4) TaxID=761193 RepID=A0A7U3ZM14_RUNSL|nr:hypothetical protein [Runella slithyformis]AEI49715.1 hypothetical protein Runsl_3347 [Runella slithyformis DSM 19594]
MDNSFEEISNKIKNGILLSEEEQQSFDRLKNVTEKFIEALKSKGLSPLQPVGEQMALISQKIADASPAIAAAHKKGLAAIKLEMDKIDWEKFGKAVKRFQVLYEAKKRLWEKDKDYYKKQSGFERDFEEVMNDLAKFYPDLKRMKVGEIFGMPDDEFRRLFDKWCVAYVEERDRRLEEVKNRHIKQAPPITPLKEVKNSKGGKKDPYNAKVKATFFCWAINEFDKTVLDPNQYKNNDEKFRAYSKAMNENFSLLIASGTLENNWCKRLNEREKTQVVKLLKEYKLNSLAVKFRLEA